MNRSILIAAALSSTLFAGALAAQTTDAEARREQPSKWDFLVTGGRIVPTGAQRETLENGGLTAAQLSFAPHPVVALTATFGWARSRDVASADNPKLDVFTYDVGTEVRAPQLSVMEMLSFRPFVGLGAGARSYNYRSLTVDATHNIAGYAAVGGELAAGRVGFRFEVRDYVTGFKPLVGTGPSDTRNDLAVMGGLRLRLR